MVWIKGKQSNPGREWCPPLHFRVVAIEKGALGSPSSMVGQLSYVLDKSSHLINFKLNHFRHTSHTPLFQQMSLKYSLRPREFTILAHLGKDTLCKISNFWEIFLSKVQNLICIITRSIGRFLFLFFFFFFCFFSRKMEEL